MIRSTSLLSIVIFFAMSTSLQAETIADVIYQGGPPVEQQKVAGSIEKARAAYASFLSGTTDSPHRATAMRRLADLELELALQELETGETVSFARPIELYRSFLQQYPLDAERDHVLYQISRALDNSGESVAALGYLQELTSRFPDSELAPEALFRQGELMFVAGDYQGSAAAYGSVYTDHHKTRYEINSRYKHGWALFKTDQFEQSLASFAGLIDLVLDPNTSVPDQVKAFSPGQREMFEDALRASSIALAQLGGADFLSVLLDDQALPQWSYLFYERLGEHYLSEERFAESAESFGAFARRVPTHAQAPILQARVIETYEAAGFTEQALQGRADFVRAYGFDAPFWNGRLPADYPDIKAQINRHLQSLTQHYHAVAQKTVDPQAVEAAVSWYRIWLTYFPAETQTPQRNFLLSELLFDAGRFDEAAMEYEQTAYGYPAHDQAVVAGYAALLARDKAYAAAADTQTSAVLRQLALDSKLRFADGWPEDPRTAAVLLTAAEELLATQQLDDAIIVASRALQHVALSATAQQRTAWVVQAHAWFDLVNHAEAENAYRSALTLTSPDDPMITDLQDRLAASVYEQGRLAREAGDQESAAGHFLRVGELMFDTAIHPVALFDASAAMIKLARWNDAATILVDFRHRYSGHELAGGIAKQLTGIYLQGDRPLDAASELSDIASTADTETATAARWQAAQLYSDNGDRQSYLETLRVLTVAAATPADDAMRAREQLLSAYLADNDTVSVHYWRQQIIAADAAAGEARSDYSRTLAARSALALAEPLAEGFSGLSLTLPLEHSLPLKKAAMEDAMKAFEQVADYGIDETSTAATFHIAELYRGFGNALMESERPPGLDELALEEYEFLLEEQAFPFEENAIEIHQINTTRAASLIFDQWVGRSFQQLALLLPARYNKVEQHESRVTQLD